MEEEFISYEPRISQRVDVFLEEFFWAIGAIEADV